MTPALLALVALPALAVQPPRPPEPVAATAIRCAHAVTFTTPYPWHYAMDAAPLSSGTVLVVVADAELLRPRNVGQRVLYVADHPVEILAQREDLALVLVGQDLGPAPVRVWFADETLPERVDAPLASRLTLGAAHLAPLSIDAWGTPSAVTGRNDLLAALHGWRRSCE